MYSHVICIIDIRRMLHPTVHPFYMIFHPHPPFNSLNKKSKGAGIALTVQQLGYELDIRGVIFTQIPRTGPSQYRHQA